MGFSPACRGGRPRWNSLQTLQQAQKSCIRLPGRPVSPSLHLILSLAPREMTRCLTMNQLQESRSKWPRHKQLQVLAGTATRPATTVVSIHHTIDHNQRLPLCPITLDFRAPRRNGFPRRPLILFHPCHHWANIAEVQCPAYHSTRPAGPSKLARR